MPNGWLKVLSYCNYWKAYKVTLLDRYRSIWVLPNPWIVKITNSQQLLHFWLFCIMFLMLFEFNNNFKLLNLLPYQVSCCIHDGIFMTEMSRPALFSSSPSLFLETPTANRSCKLCLWKSPTMSPVHKQFININTGRLIRK